MEKPKDIIKEEIIRDEVRKILVTAGERKKNKFFDFFNSALGIFILTTVFVTFGSWLFSTFSTYRDSIAAREKILYQLSNEISYRLDLIKEMNGSGMLESQYFNFSATTLKSYLWRYSTWSYYDAASQVVFNWDVSSSLGNQFIKDLPAEITSAHPAISLSNLKHASTTFYTQSPAFESYVDWDFKVNPEPTGTRLGIKIITN